MRHIYRDGNNRMVSLRLRSYVRRWITAGLLAVACSRGERAVNAAPASKSIMTDVVLTVDNRMPSLLIVYLESAGRIDSLGTVARGMTRSFSVPSGIGDSSTVLYLRARNRASAPGIRSQAFHLAPGEQVLWTVDRSRSVVSTR